MAHLQKSRLQWKPVKWHRQLPFSHTLFELQHSRLITTALTLRLALNLRPGNNRNKPLKLINGRALGKLNSTPLMISYKPGTWSNDLKIRLCSKGDGFSSASWGPMVKS